MRIHQSAVSFIDYPDVSITDYVLRKAAELADKTAFVEGMSGRKVSYGDLAGQIRALAGGLAARGVGTSTTWALMAPNLPEYAVVFHGLAYAGACVTTLNPTYGAEELAFQLKDSKATAIITVELFLEVAKDAAQRAGVDEVIVIGPGDATPLSSLFGEPLTQQVAVTPKQDVVVLPYSSGTTGFPKGVMLTHHNLVANLEQLGGHLELASDEVCYAVLPFFHIYGMQVLMNFALSRGVTVVSVPRFDLVKMLELVQEQRITRLFLVPPIILALAKHPIVDKYDLSSVKQIFSGAAPLGGEIAEAAASRLGCSIAQGYGMTELSPVTHIVPEDDYKAASVGTLVADTEARLIDPDTGKDAEPGQPGEIWVRGPQVMKGYLGNPEATALTIDADGWLHTGDIGTVDEDGHTFIVDRLKELIKVKGFQVPPAELEALLITHPEVADVAVIGVPDAEAGEKVKAFVVRGGDSTLSAETLQSFVAGQVASYKQVSEVEFIDAIPKSASGKILRRELRTR
jgi:4-coumarate--CoA ligase